MRRWITRAARSAMAAGVAGALLAGCGGGSGDTAGSGSGTTQRQVSVRIDSTVGSGETFAFSLGTQSLTITQGGVVAAFATALDQGSVYAVNQTAGPRSCTLSTNRSGTVGGTNVLVTAQCGTPAGSSALRGQLRGPVNSQVTLRNNGGDDLAVTVPGSGGERYNAAEFAFATPLADGSAYQVGLATQPNGQTCRVYKGASGTTPVAIDILKVGCEWTFDFVSRSTDDSVLGSDVDSGAPAIGGDDVWGEGRFIAFVSYAVGMGGASGAYRQIFWRDRLTGETRLVSTNAAGEPGNQNSFAPAISADGLTVVFESYASNLVPGDSNGVRDVFVWSAAGGTLTTGVQRVSVGPGGTQADAESFEPTVSADGKVVAFSTSASNLTSGVSGSSTVNVVRRDLPSGTNTLVTRGSVGAGNGVGVGGGRPALSEDGNRLAFWSFSAQLVAGDTNGLWDIFVYQHDSATLRRVSLSDTGGERNQGTESTSRVVAPAISGNGRFVAYATTASNVVAGDTNGAQDVFVVDLDAGLAVRRVSVASDGTQGNADSPVGQGERVALSVDGQWVAFTTMASNLGVPANNVVLVNTLTRETRAVSVSATGSVGVPSMSRRAGYVSFGASHALDARFASSGLFARFTDLTPAFFWID